LDRIKPPSLEKLRRAKQDYQDIFVTFQACRAIAAQSGDGGKKVTKLNPPAAENIFLR